LSLDNLYFIIFLIMYEDIPKPINKYKSTTSRVVLRIKPRVWLVLGIKLAN